MLKIIFFIAIIYICWKFVLPWINKEFGMKIGAAEIFAGIVAIIAWAFKTTSANEQASRNQMDELNKLDDQSLVRIMDSDPDHSRRMGAKIILENRMKRRRNL
ncbi:hypothetical protein [Ligilactobacillus apodemi]|nr:hypothetical protein [Ligilactobacillus apodemi]